MSSGITILIASSTAAAVIVLAVVLSKMVRTVAHDPHDLVPDFSRLRRPFRRRSVGPWLGVRPVADGVHAVPAEPKHRDGAESAASAVEEPTVAPGRSDLRDAEREATLDEGTDPYGQVGEEVAAAVLTAAEQAAAQIRQAAAREEERARHAAEEKAAAIVAEVEARREAVDDYSEEKRADADAYAENTRRRADEIAARKISEAEEQARLIRVEAERKGREIEADALSRRDALAKNAELMEGRIESMLAAFRTASGELEPLLPPERRSGDDEPARRTEVRLDEALRPGAAHERLGAEPDS